MNRRTDYFEKYDLNEDEFIDIRDLIDEKLIVYAVKG